MMEKLINKYFPAPEAQVLILEHSRLVAEKALQLADAAHTDTPLDKQFIVEAAMLHDIGVCRTDAPKLNCSGPFPYICHGIIGREILEAEGMQRHALVCERHIGVGLTAGDIMQQQLPLPVRNMAPVSNEEKLVCMADLFYSKKPGEVTREKSLAEVRQELGKFGEEKVAIFDGWIAEFYPERS
jgi:uncharacterized protein